MTNEPRTSARAGTGVVTFMFSDLVDSTHHLAALGEDAAEEFRREYFAVLRTAVAGSGGHEVKNLGDGLMVVFASPFDALRAAVAVQRAVAARNARPGTRAFWVRLGLHAGEPMIDREDYFGTPVVIAKRLCDRAVGGQILASALLAGLVGPARPGGPRRRPARLHPAEGSRLPAWGGCRLRAVGRGPRTDPGHTQRSRGRRGVRGLPRRPGDVAAPRRRGPGASKGDARPRLAEGIVRVLGDLARRATVIVVLDDLHLADASSWETLRHLARAGARWPVLVVATVRPDELLRNDAAAHVQFELEQDGLLTRLPLAPLEPAGIALAGEIADALSTLGVAAPLVQIQRVDAIGRGVAGKLKRFVPLPDAQAMR